MNTRFEKARAVAALAMLACVMGPGPARSQMPGGQTFAFKIYKTNYALHPFVQAYIRTFDQNMDPIPNLNYANIRLMVKGKTYDPQKASLQTRQSQYYIETLQNRAEEGIRTVIVWDCSKTMKGQPFEDAKRAIQTFIQAKRANDQVALLAIRDRKEGYQIVSQFEKDGGLLYTLMNDVQCDGEESHIYDTIGAALEMCAGSSQGGNSTEGADFAILNAVMVVSDGKDEGSTVTREELGNHLARLNPPVPIYSLAYSGLPDGPKHVKNLQSLSKQTLGRFWDIHETKEFATVTMRIHEINRQDYVVTFRSYVPVDGNSHNYKIAVEYPSGTGKLNWEEDSFQAIDATPDIAQSPRLSGIFQKLQQAYPLRPDGPFPPDGSAPMPIITQDASNPVPLPVPVPTPPPPPEPSNNVLLIVLIGLGVVMALVIVVLLVKLKGGGGSQGGGYRDSRGGRGTTDPGSSYSAKKTKLDE